MKFDNILNTLYEASQHTIEKLNKMEEYFDSGDFVKIYPEQRKRYIDHVRRENYAYKKKGDKWYALLIVLKSRTKEEDRENLVEIIKDLEIIKDNKAKISRNGIIIKIMIKDESVNTQQDGKM